MRGRVECKGSVDFTPHEKHGHRNGWTPLSIFFLLFYFAKKRDRPQEIKKAQLWV